MLRRGYGVAIASAACGHLDQKQLLDVTRDRCLCHADMACAQGLCKSFLRLDDVLFDDLLNEVMAPIFHYFLS